MSQRKSLESGRVKVGSIPDPNSLHQRVGVAYAFSHLLIIRVVPNSLQSRFGLTWADPNSLHQRVGAVYGFPHLLKIRVNPNSLHTWIRFDSDLAHPLHQRLAIDSDWIAPDLKSSREMNRLTLHYCSCIQHSLSNQVKNPVSITYTVAVT